MDAMPTPIPAANRMQIKLVKLSEKAIPNDDTAKINAASNNPGLRPYLSASDPAAKQPTMHPNANDPVRKPSHHALRSKAVRRNGSAPEITAKSKPKR